MAVAEASLRISILAIWLGAISLRDPEKGMPLSTISGLLLAVNERVPRMRICIGEPGWEEVCDISIPGRRPFKASVILDAGTSLTASPLMEVTEPVTDSSRC